MSHFFRDIIFPDHVTITENSMPLTPKCPYSYDMAGQTGVKSIPTAKPRDAFFKETA